MNYLDLLPDDLIEVINKRFYQMPVNDEEIVYDKSMIKVVRPPPETVNNDDDDDF